MPVGVSISDNGSPFLYTNTRHNRLESSVECLRINIQKVWRPKSEKGVKSQGNKQKQ